MKIAIIGLGRMGVAQARIARFFGDEICWAMDCSDAARDSFAKLFDVPVMASLDALDYGRPDVIWLTVSDGCIEECAKQIAAFVRPGTIVWHTSGALNSAILKKHLAQAFCGSYHPLMACPLISVSDDACVDAYRGVIHSVEGDADAVRLAENLTQRFGGKLVKINRDAKIKYHAAAVFASNYPLVILDTSVKMLMECGFGEDEARDAAMRMCQQCLNSAQNASFVDALTGPAKRHDLKTLDAHHKALEDSPDHLELYEVLKEAAFRMLGYK